jgi:hypothetical protein
VISPIGEWDLDPGQRHYLESAERLVPQLHGIHGGLPEQLVRGDFWHNSPEWTAAVLQRN